MAEIFPTARMRRSPYYEATLAEGVTAFQTYNRMLLPIRYGDLKAEYERLTRAVSMWDVAVERQVELAGPDAAALAQALVPRDLSRMQPGQGRYAPLCDHFGVLVNDPVLLKLDEDRFWLSIADSDVLLWARAVAGERGLDVAISEPDVSPLAIQGPKAEDVVAAIFGDWVRGIRFFGFADAEIEGIPLKVARSGWSRQGGFELYLMDGTRGLDLWRIVREAGQPFGIGPGAPNPVERIESGLLSWGGDTDWQTNPFEVRLERYIDLDVDAIGMPALRRIAKEGPRRHQLGVMLDAGIRHEPHAEWSPVTRDGERIGDMTNGIWSWRFERMIGFGLVSRAAAPGDRVEVHRGGQALGGVLTELPFV